MLTLQSNKEIRINKGDTGMAPLLINIGDSLRPIGYEFNIPVKVTCSTSIDFDFYEDAGRDHVLEGGVYVFTFTNDVGYLNLSEEIDISAYGFVFREDIIEGTTITVEYRLLDNDSMVYFQLGPILEDPEEPLLQKVMYPKENKIVTYLDDEVLYEETKNVVNSYGEILLGFNPEDTENIDRGKYLYQLRAYLYDKYTNSYKFETIINRTPFYIIDDNFSQRVG